MSRQKPTTIMVAIDLGTTYSSITWAEACEGTHHVFLDNWPDSAPGFGNVSDAVKVPTEIRLKENEDGHEMVLWGYQIPLTARRQQWFKLAIDPTGREILNRELTLPHRDPRRLQITDYKTNQKATIKFLKALHVHFLEEVMKKLHFGAYELKRKKYKFEYVVTVPGIWTMTSAAKTVDCVINANIGSSSSVKVLSEPEAAAFLTLKCHGHEPGMQVGKTVVICDAGGGTVDLVTVTIQERDPLRLSEAAPASGSLCGGVFLNRGFEKFLNAKLKGREGWGPTAMQRAMMQFESEKRVFSKTDRSDKIFRILGMPDDPSVGISKGRLKVTWKEMEGIFRPIVAKIISLIKGQLADSQQLVDAVILTGGLGQNSYIYQVIQEALPRSVKLFAPKNGWAAVSAGALLKGLDGSGYVIESRMTRKNLGISASIPFDPDSHDEVIMWYTRGGKQYVDEMEWFIKKGEVYERKKVVQLERFTTWKRDSDIQSVLIRFDVHSCDTALGVDPPPYRGKFLKLETTVRCNFKANERLIRKICQVKDGTYKIPYRIIITYSSTRIDYDVVSPVANNGDIQVQVEHK